MNQFIVTCTDASATMKVAEKIATQLKGGELIELIGDVGSGKTTFVRGLAAGLNCKDDVSSPSFALKNVYGGRLKLHHFDLYRLNAPGALNHELKESFDDQDVVVVIEWAKLASPVLPKHKIKVEFSVVDENTRKLKVSL